MKKLFKIQFSFFLLLIFLYQYAGYLFVFILLHQNLQNEFRESVSAEENFGNKDLIEIVVPRSWVFNPNKHFQLKEKNEFSLDGKMYDFVSSEVKGDKVIYTCMQDEKEEKILADFDEHQTNATAVSNRYSSQGKSLKNRLKIFISAVIMPSERDVFIAFSRQFYFKFKKEKYNSASPEINSPPPEFFYS